MNRKKVALGIIITIAGAIMMITNMVFGIIKVAGSLHDDLYTLSVPLDKQAKTDNIQIAAGKNASIWLKLPDRQVENKNFEFDTTLIKQDGFLAAEFLKNFRFGYLRNSSGNGQYYKLGNYHFQNDFKGYFRTSIAGDWIPPYNGYLVLRESKATAIPFKEIGLFLLGLFVLIMGIGTITKNSK